MNKITIVGRLGEDPQVRQVGGVNVCTFSLAENSARKDSEGNRLTNWFRCSVWRERGDVCAKYLHKGDQVTVIGDLVARQFTDKNGAVRTSLDVTVTDFEFGGKGNGGNGNEEPRQEPRRAPAKAPMPADDEDDLPF